MKKHNRRAYRSKIVAEIWLDPSVQNPPHIHTAMKKLLDIFEQPLPESGIKRKGLIYQNDNQISYLSVRYHLGSVEGGIRAKFAPFRHFIDNLKLAYEILSGRYNDSIDRYEFERELEEFNRYREDHSFSDAIEDLRRHEADKERFVEHFGIKAYNSMHIMDKMHAQESLLSMSKLSVDDLYNVFNTSEIFQNNVHLRGISEIVAGWVTDSPIRMQLPSLPTEEGQRNQYKEHIREYMRGFQTHYDILQPLYIPVIIEVIYKPPIASEGFYKDLDNIIRDFILPIFHEEFRPPPTHGSVFTSVEYEDGDPLEGMIRDIPKSVPYSVAGYEIVEIPRHPDDEEDGFLVVGLSPGSFASHSLWYRIDDIIEKWGKCIENRW
ncbi:MAG: hypothetical protein JRJ79_14240 [Deltaproteobacteria bacterium]|nr:hypothetical protein [Deltaproteobacteria bacterium]